MTLVDPVPSVVWTASGTTYPAGLAPGASAAQLDELSVTWGRSRFTEHHDAQTARFGLLVHDTARVAEFTGFDWLGRPVELRWSYTDPSAGPVSRTFFRGRVSEYHLTPRPPHPETRAPRGVVLEFTAAGQLTDLGNRLSGVESWPDEPMSARVDRVRAIAGDAVAGIAYRDTVFAPGPVAARNVQNNDALSLLKSLYDSIGGDRLAYDPHTNAIGYVRRRAVPAMVAGYRFRAALYDDSAFGQGIAPRVATPSTAYPALDGRWIEADLQLTKAIEQRVTRVEYQWSEAGTAKTGVVLDPGLEADRGVVALQASTEWRQGDWALQTGHDWLDAVWREGSKLQPPPLTYRADRAGGFPSLTHAQLLIGGAELTMSSAEQGSNSAVYVMATPWAAAGTAPAFGVIGGTIRYDHHGWRPSINLQAIWHDDLSDQRPVRIGELTVPLGAGTRRRFPLSELARGVTFADLRHLAPRP